MLENLSNIHIIFFDFHLKLNTGYWVGGDPGPTAAGDAGLETQVPRIRPSPWQARMECLVRSSLGSAPDVFSWRWKNGAFKATKSEGWTDVFCWLESKRRMNHEFGLSPRCSYVFFFELFVRMMLLAVILGVVGVSLSLLPASWNLKLAKVFVSWGIRWDFCSGYWDYWYVKTMHTSVSPIDTNTDGPWNMYLRLQIFRHCEYVQFQEGKHNRQKPKIEVMSWNSPRDLDHQTPQGQAAHSSCPFRWGPRDAGGVMEWSGLGVKM